MVDRSKIVVFSNKIKEAIIKLQKTLPKELTEEEIELISNNITAYVLRVVEAKCGEHLNLSTLLCRKEIIDKGITYIEKLLLSGEKLPIGSEYDENIPYLELFITPQLLAVANHRGQILYSTDEDKYKPTADYLVKPHAQTMREMEEENKNKGKIENPDPDKA